MNRKRCPWCGKRIHKDRDTIFWKDAFLSPSVPRMLRQANCGHCGHKYGQVPLIPHVLKIGLVVLLLVILAFVFQSALLFLVAFIPCFLFTLMPYSKLDDEGKCYEENTDLFCEIVMIDEYQKIKCDELYFLDHRFDDFEPFVLASPISIYYIPKKSNRVLGKFLYMNEKNYEYIKKSNCQLYDTEMNLVANIKFTTDGDTVLEKSGDNSNTGDGSMC